MNIHYRFTHFSLQSIEFAKANWQIGELKKGQEELEHRVAALVRENHVLEAEKQTDKAEIETLHGELQKHVQINSSVMKELSIVQQQNTELETAWYKHREVCKNRNQETSKSDSQSGPQTSSANMELLKRNEEYSNEILTLTRENKRLSNVIQSYNFQVGGEHNYSQTP